MADHHELPPVDPKIAAAAREGCSESRLLLSRRAMLGVTAGLFSAAFLPDFAKAATNPDARFLVVVLRGGMDGIGTLVPKLDPHYVDVRKQLALPFARTLSLGSDFALHPAMTNTLSMFQKGEVAFAPAVGLPLRNRSHFECQDNLENGLPENIANATGWLNRMLGALPAGDPIRVNQGIEIGMPPLILRGPEPVLGWSPTWFEKARADNVSRLQTCYTAVDMPLWQSLSRGLAADAMATAAGAGKDNVSDLRKAFMGAAKLMQGTNAPRVAVLSVDGWDMHAQEGTFSGYLNDQLTELDQALHDLKINMLDVWPNTVVICVTEFGRTVHANGDSGTDHGIGTVSLLVGGAVKSQFIGDWPGLANNQLYDGDLRPTVDVRSLFKGILRDHLGVDASVIESTVFPASLADAPAISGLVKNPVVPASKPGSYAAQPISYSPAAPIARYRQRYGVHGLG